MEFASTAHRVTDHTPEQVNHRIHARTVRSLKYYRAYPDEIPDRLQELDREWDIERVLATHASTLILAGTGLGFLWNRRLLLLPATVAGFLLQHSLQGWCPPVFLLRRLGVRTAGEIENERYNLLAIQQQMA